jgi:hypothetical protein
MTKVALCNRALAMIGEDAEITALSPPDGSVHAARGAKLLDDAIEWATESRHWSFADRRMALVPVRVAIDSVSTGGDSLTTALAHGLEDNDPFTVELVTGSALPAPFEADTVYYASSTGTTTLQALDAVDGDVVDITTSGTGTFRIVKQSDRAGVAHMYALPSDCLVERELLPAGAPDGWPGNRVTLLATTRQGVFSLAWNGREYAVAEFAGGCKLPFKRAQNHAGEQVIYCDVEDAELLYSAYVDDYAQWPPLFRQAVQCKLQAGLAGAIKRDPKLIEYYDQKAQAAINEAARVDAGRSHETPAPVNFWRR